MISGAAVSADNIIGYFHIHAIHSIPITINLIGSALLRAASGDPSAGIQVSHEPLEIIRRSSDSLSNDEPSDPMKNRRCSSREEEFFNKVLSYLFLGTFIGMLFWFTSGCLIILAIKERVSNAKHLQFISGAHFFVFWMSNFLVDFLLLCIPFLIILTVIATTMTDYFPAFTTSGALVHLGILSMFYAWASIPWIYLLSFCFKSPSK